MKKPIDASFDAGQMTSSDPFRFFDRIYCVNLDGRPDRWQEASREFNAIGIAERVERVPAITHDSPREGCRLSHLACVRHAQTAGAETILIFEDDVIFRGFSRERLAHLLRLLQMIPDWELFYLGGAVLAYPETCGELMRAPMLETHAYAIHRRAFAKIQSSTVPYDVWLAQNAISYCANPMLAWQRDGFSDLERKWIAAQRLATDQYLKFVAIPKAEKIVRNVLRQQQPWRMFRMRIKIRLGRLLSGGKTASN